MKLKRILSGLLAMALLLSMAACVQNPDDNQPTETPDTPGAKATYTVTVKNAGGLPMEGLDIYVYTDSTLNDLVNYGKTDASGKAEISLTSGGKYAAVISGAPKGYQVEATYPITSNKTDITLTSSLITGGNLADVKLGLGDIMYDFTVTDPDGNKITLSEVMEGKEMVLLNFWYTKCSPCRTEFPYMEQAYQTFKDKVGVIALNSWPTEDDTDVKNYPAAYGVNVSFPMAKCPTSWAQTFGVEGYPTSIVIDRYGRICLIEVGALPSVTPFNTMFSYYSSEDYQQKLCPNGVADITEQVKPNVSMPSSEEMGAVLNKGDITVSYTPAGGNDAEYSWPFVLGQKDGYDVAYASNKGIDSSYSILHATVTLKAGQAVGFDYQASCENGVDILYVLVNDNDIYRITGVAEAGEWKECYPWVAIKDGEYEVSLCYLKDGGGAAGDDTVYVKDFRVVDAKDIKTATYIPRLAANSENGFDYDYVTVVYNEKDGYYHVGTKDGPLLLADLTNTSQFNEERSVFDMLASGDITVNGHNYYEDVLPFCSYASNSSLSGVCTVTKELAEYLQIVAQVAGFGSGENEWLQICRYYDAYGTGGKQLVDPIAGLSPFSALVATLGKNVPTNCITYDRPIIPRGLFAKFVPTQSGVYRITSRNPNKTTVEGWIFDENMKEVMVYEMDERLLGMQYPNGFDEVSMVLYMEAGTPYFIDICYWDLYETGTIYYDIEYVGKTLNHFRLASPGYFTFEDESMYYTVAGGVKPVLYNGKYYVDLGNGERGSLLYADFTGVTPIFNMPLKDMIDAGGFDFTRTENDETILQYMAKNDNDPEKTKAYLKELWGDGYEENAAEFKLDDVLAGKYHGKGQDMTEEARKYLSKMYSGSDAERVGCVEMTAELAELLQMLMDKYTFAGVDHSWTKVCYYYDFLGPKN